MPLSVITILLAFIFTVLMAGFCYWALPSDKKSFGWFSVLLMVFGGLMSGLMFFIAPKPTVESSQVVTNLVQYQDVKK